MHCDSLQYQTGIRITSELQWFLKSELLESPESQKNLESELLKLLKFPELWFFGIKRHRIALIFMQILSCTHGSNNVFDIFVIPELHTTAGIAKITGITSTHIFLESELLEPLESPKLLESRELLIFLECNCWNHSNCQNSSNQNCWNRQKNCNQNAGTSGIANCVKSLESELHKS